MSTLSDRIRLLASGGAVPEMTVMRWALHGGLTGDGSMLLVRSDRKVIEVLMDPNDPLGPPPNELGTINADQLKKLAQALVTNGFDDLPPPPPPTRPGAPTFEFAVTSGNDKLEYSLPTSRLDTIPQLGNIRNAFTKVRQVFPS